ncbi:MAG: trypsin-like peptidase domain-containing protein [Pseudomonadales bacterium]|jgi:S1-C subfamily serine protease|nr:trypsin-like peptidase domain-containing protein [Pseudomonadales bacterium]
MTLASRSRRFAAALGLAFGCAAAPLLAAEAPDYLSFQTEDEANNIEIFKAASPSVVYVTNSALRRDYYSLNVHEIPQGSGTGFVWDQSGLIVTNFHVIQGASRVTITLQDQSDWDAEVVGLAPGKDLALLRITAPAERLTPLPLGDSSLLDVGRKVIAIGNPFGLDTTMTVGVVSALGREINSLTERKIRDVIQTDASINPGNSGGPLLNSLGQLVGVNTQIISPSGASAGIGFAIPVNTVKKVIPQLLEYGREVQPTLGIQYVSDAVARQRGIEGLIVAAVNPNAPAGRAGLQGLRQDRRGGYQIGDIIVEIDGDAVHSSDDMFNALEQHQPGDTVTVVTQRDDARMEFQVALTAPDAA